MEPAPFLYYWKSRITPITAAFSRLSPVNAARSLLLAMPAGSGTLMFRLLLGRADSGA